VFLRDREVPARRIELNVGELPARFRDLSLDIDVDPSTARAPLSVAADALDQLLSEREYSSIAREYMVQIDSHIAIVGAKDEANSVKALRALGVVIAGP
jgi:hypothetical protein